LWAFSLRGHPGVRVFSAVLVTRRPSRAVDRASIFAVVGGSMFGEQHTFAEGEDLHVGRVTVLMMRSRGDGWPVAN
jgi:hypothetical protein